MKNAREVCLSALLRVEKDKGYSNIVLDSLLSKAEISKEDKAFATRLFYGTLEKQILLDFNLSKLSNKPLDRLDKEILCILRMGLYQLLYMPNIPDSAAVNESVKLCYFTKKSFAKSFVNAALRNKIREGKKVLLPEESDKAYLSVLLSADESITSLFESQFGREKTISIFSAFDSNNSQYVRVNTNKLREQDLIEKLAKNETLACKTDVENCLKIEKSAHLVKTEEFERGEFYFQDFSCQCACKALDVEKAKRILDVCAAPGSKSFTLSQMSQGAEVVSCDISENRVSLIKSGAQRLDIKNIKPTVQDATVFNENLGKFDRILCDVPCSGLGVIGKKPEIRLKKIDLNTLYETQLKILNNSSKYLEKGGVLVYSTCTLNRRENEDVVNAFLKQNADFEPHPLSISENGEFCKTFMPDTDDCDGFFVCSLRKK